MKTRSRQLRTSNLIEEWASQGRYHFSTKDVSDELGKSTTAARSALRRLKKRGRIASPQRGFHVTVPPEYRELESLPAEQFVPQLLALSSTPYYAALLTAARLHGAGHQQPQSFQVMVDKNRRPIEVGRVRVQFIARLNAALMPTDTVNTPRGVLRVSTPETTAFDLVGYSEHCGGLDHVATVLEELGEVIRPDLLASSAPKSPLPWCQRLGYLLDRFGHRDRTNALASFVATQASDTVSLIPRQSADRAARNARWKLLINGEVETDFDP
ncbi:MAG: type IV toxin-antitoxin system AbiEi family antitoxin [Myxococcota bacterium]